jgi:sugar phosphate isomerase/epimerase
MKSLRISRREWLARGGAVALTCGSKLLGRAAPRPDGAKTNRGGFMLGVCDWTIGKRCDPAALALAQRLGLDGVQVDLGPSAEVLPLQDAALQEKYRQAVKATGVEVASLAIASLNEVPYKSDPRAERWVAASIDVSKALGTRVVLLAFFAKGDLRNDPKGVDAVVEKLKDVAPKAEKANVILGVESQLNARQHMEILDRVGSPAVQVYYDVGNSHHEGYDIYQEIRFLGQHICEFHAKDYDGLYGKGSINFPEVRRAMDDVGYRGWIHIEGVKFSLGLEKSIRYDARYLRSVFPPKV